MGIYVQISIFLFLVLQSPEDQSKISAAVSVFSVDNGGRTLSDFSEISNQTTDDTFTITSTDKPWINPKIGVYEQDFTAKTFPCSDSSVAAQETRRKKTPFHDTITSTLKELTCDKQFTTNTHHQPEQDVLLSGYCQQKFQGDSTKPTFTESEMRSWLELNCDNPNSALTPEELTNFTKLAMSNCTNLDCFPCTCNMCELGACCAENLAEMDQDWGQYTGCVSEANIHAIVRCPQTWPVDSEVRQACEQGSGRMTRDQPVSDPVNNVTFRNEHCATCHGVLGYQRWKSSLVCQHFQYVYTAETEEELVEKALQYTNTCSVSHVKPDDVQAQECSADLKWYDTQHIVTSCNVTGQWGDWDESLVRNCARYKAIAFRVGEKISNVVYQNIYCAVCNGVRVMFGQHFCNVLTSPQQEVSIPPLTLLLGVHSGGERPLGPPRVTDSCPTGTWRNLEDTCEPVRCTKGKVFSEDSNQCSTAISTIGGLAYDLDLTLLPREHLSLSNDSGTWQQFTVNFKEVLKAKLLYLADYYSIQCFPAVMCGADDVLSVQEVKVKGWVVSNRKLSRDVVERTWVNNLLKDWKIDYAENKTIELTFVHSLYSVNKFSFDNTPKQFHFGLKWLKDFDEKNEFPLHLNIPLTPLLSCPFVQFEAHQFKVVQKLNVNTVDIILKSGTSQTKLPMNSHFYIWNQILYVCITELEKLDREGKYRLNIWDASHSLYIISMTVLPLSLLSLLLLLFIHAVLPALRTQPGLNMMGTCVSLLAAQLSLLLAAHRLVSGVLCVALGVVVHVSWLSTFCWTFVSSLHMYQTFSLQSPAVSARCSVVMMAKNSLLATVVVPGGVVFTVMATSFFISGGQSVGYSPVTCYLSSPWLVGLSVIAPLVLIILANVFFFVHTVWHIRQVVRLQVKVENETRSRQHHLTVCLRLSLLTGATWILSLLAENLDFDWLRVLSVLTNGGQGVLLLLSYVTTRRVVTMLTLKLRFWAGEGVTSSNSPFFRRQKTCTKATEIKSSMKVNPFK